MLRLVWGLCLAFGAAVMGLGLELHAAGAGWGTSVPVVLAGILFLPLASAVIDRFLQAAPSSER
jgi:hypothetical protein